MTEVVVKREKLTSLVLEKLMNVGINQEHAEIVADVLVHANLRNVNSHGVLRTKHYVKRIKEGGINIDPEITEKGTGPSSAVVDGDNGMGHVITKKAMDKAVKLATNTGIGMVGVINSSHCGALSYFINQATEEGMIGIAMTQTDKFVVPFGGAEPFFGTNPIAFGFPSKKNKPIILDMATSNAAMGKVLHARETGGSIPESWGVDKNGDKTTEPNDVSALLPFGGPKGYGLGMVVDIFSGILTGSAFGPHISKMYGDLDKMRELGHFLIAINPNTFTDSENFKSNIDRMINEIHSVKPAKDIERVMLPGEPEQIHEEKRLSEGIPITKSVYDFLIGND